MLTKEVILEYAEKSGAAVGDIGVFFPNETLNKFCAAIAGFIVSDLSAVETIGDDGKPEMALSGGLVEIVGETLINALKASNAPNYLEMRFSHRKTAEEYAVLISRVICETPAEKNEKAEAVIRELRDAVTALLVWSDPNHINARNLAVAALDASERYSRRDSDNG